MKSHTKDKTKTKSKSHQAIDGLKSLGFHSTPQEVSTKKIPPTDPTIGLRDAGKAAQVAGLARAIAMLGEGD